MKKVGKKEDGAEPGAREGKKYSEKGKQRISRIYLTGSSNIVGIFFLLLGEAGGNDNRQTREGGKKGKRKDTKIGK